MKVRGARWRQRSRILACDHRSFDVTSNSPLIFTAATAKNSEGNDLSLTFGKSSSTFWEVKHQKYMSQSAIRVAVEGCGHGTLNSIYASIEKSCEVKGWDGIDLLIIGGDFQASFIRTSNPDNEVPTSDIHFDLWPE